MYKKIIVTGSSAVLGSAVKSISGDYTESEFIFVSSKECDLTDAKATRDYVEAQAPDAIIHLAAVSGGIGISTKYPARILRDNVQMNFSILDAAVTCKIKKVVMTLSVGMYPTEAPLPLCEESIHDGNPHLSAYSYAFAKRLIEPSVRAYHAEFGLNIIGLIPNGIFGENDNFNYDDAPMLPAQIRRFYESKKSGAEIIVWGDGSPMREYTYSKDMAKAFMWCLENYNDPQVLNVGSIEEHTIKEIVYIIAEIMDIDKARLKFDTSKPKGIFRRPTDNSKFLAMSNFRYTPFRVGLEHTIKWFIETYENAPHLLKFGPKLKNLG